MTAQVFGTAIMGAIFENVRFRPLARVAQEPEQPIRNPQPAPLLRGFSPADRPEIDHAFFKINPTTVNVRRPLQGKDRLLAPAGAIGDEDEQGQMPA